MRVVSLLLPPRKAVELAFVLNFYNVVGLAASNASWYKSLKTLTYTNR